MILSLTALACTSLFSFFDLGVQRKFLEDLSLAVVSLFGMFMAVIVAAGQFPAESENKTIYPLLARPVSRREYILGKWLGVILVVLVNISAMAALFIFILWSKNLMIQPGLLDAMYLLYIQAVFMASLAIFFSIFLTRGANICLSVLFYFLGHVKSEYLNYLISRSELEVEKNIYRVLYYLLPNLENFNIKHLLTYDFRLPMIYILKTSLYSLGFSLVFLAAAVFLFRRKEL